MERLKWDSLSYFETAKIKDGSWRRGPEGSTMARMRSELRDGKKEMLGFSVLARTPLEAGVMLGLGFKES